MPRESLPIDEVLPEIISKLSSAGTIVLKAPTGAGKTTRVAPAILDAGLATLSNNRAAQVVVLQPRRVAARAAAMRICDERGGTIGEEIGYHVRYERRFSRRTRILVCTEGVFLRRLQNDPLLENTSAVVFDEFHERNLDSDLALALVRQVQAQVRPDLHILVMSATLDPEPVAAYLNNCPTITSRGRTHPIEIEYLPAPSSVSLDQLATDAVKRMLPRTSGHLLVFLPGLAEIRQTQTMLESTAAENDLSLLPLYGDLPLDEQQRVLQTSKLRKVVLATNVAETSLTIDGVTGVIDTGMARINRFDPHVGLNRLELERISRASADQRAGRAGRQSAGICFRLWSEREQHLLREFETPEIARVDLSECMLQLLAWGEQDVRSFGWFESPPEASVDRALQLLDRLDALAQGTLTELGRRMARLPLQPRLARLFFEGASGGQDTRAALCAAMLSERDPFRRPTARARAEHHSDSDVLDRLAAIEDFAVTGHRDSVAGQLMSGAARQILRAGTQLLRLTVEANQSAKEQTPLDSTEPDDIAPWSKTDNPDLDETMLRALMSAFPDRVCKRRAPNSRSALMVGGRGVRLADESAVAEGDLFVAIELNESGKSETLVRQASRIERGWLPPAHVTTTTEVAYDPERQKVMARCRTRFCDLTIEENITALPADVDAGTILAEGIAAQFDVSTLVDDQAKRYLARVQCLREWMPELALPDFAADPWSQLLPDWCAGCSSVAELRAHSPVAIIQSRMTHQQLIAVDREAPERLLVPSGRHIALEYEAGKPPVMAVRIQELFGMAETPRVANSRVPVLLHLLAPNFRVQQITPDLAGFWRNTYAEVKKELKARYPKHAWPDNPLVPQSPRGAQRGK